MAEVQGYFLTWTTSGTWLHGDGRGSKDRNHSGLGELPSAPDPGLNRYRRFQLGDQVFVLDSVEKRHAVGDAILRTCELQEWPVWALNVRTNHVHVVLSASPPPEQVLSSLKAWATKQLVARELVARGTRIWTRHGSTRYLWSADDVNAASQYTMEGQGPDLG